MLKGLTAKKAAVVLVALMAGRVAMKLLMEQQPAKEVPLVFFMRAMDTATLALVT